MEFLFNIKNHYFSKGCHYLELDKIRNKCWFISLDIHDEYEVPYDGPENDLIISTDIHFKSVQILTDETFETSNIYKALLDMSHFYSYELREVTFKNLPDEDGIYSNNIWFDEEDINFGGFKKLCTQFHLWNGDRCSKCGVNKKDWSDAYFKTV